MCVHGEQTGMILPKYSMPLLSLSWQSKRVEECSSFFYLFPAFIYFFKKGSTPIRNIWISGHAGRLWSFQGYNQWSCLISARTFTFAKGLPSFLSLLPLIPPSPSQTCFGISSIPMEQICGGTGEGRGSIILQGEVLVLAGFCWLQPSVPSHFPEHPQNVPFVAYQCWSLDVGRVRTSGKLMAEWDGPILDLSLWRWSSLS